MKFLNLETGHTFDGIWKNISHYTDWVLANRVLPVKCDNPECDYVSGVNDSDLYKLMQNPSIEILYSDIHNAINPGESDIWYNEFNFETSSRYAYRYKVPQTKGYIYWFPNEQSTGITYTMPICVLTTNNTPLHIKIEDNPVFSFISASDEFKEIDGYKFIEPNFSLETTTNPQTLGKYYAHVFHIACYSKNAGEYICKVILDDENYFRVGADLYGEYEPAYINLSNMGVELPDMIQKAIYDVDPHEDVKDNIIINRKFKELLINYWDIVANRGSYKSLVNSINWFEWNNLQVKEIWKHYEAGLEIYDDREIMSLFENKIKDAQNNFIKTAYVSLYCSLQEELDTYDSEMNPELCKAVLKWSREDIQLKIALLAKFFGIYFMPIHLSLMHAAAEDKVFTNTIKAIHGNELKRIDNFGDFSYVQCNIKDTDVFRLGNVSTQVTTSTVFGSKENNDYEIFGVDVFPTNNDVTNTTLPIFSNQYYTGPGVIIPVEFVIPNQTNGDFIKHTIVKHNDKQFNFYDLLPVIDNKIEIKFNLLAKTAKKYEYTFMFLLGSGKTITRKLSFNVTDPDSLSINIYKVCAKDDSGVFGFDEKDFRDTTVGRFFLKIQNNKEHNKYYFHYLPYMTPDNPLYKNYNGIKLNRTVVFDVLNKSGKFARALTEHEVSRIIFVMEVNFFKFEKKDDDGKLTYLTFVSRRFYEDIPEELKNDLLDCNTIRNDLGFYPQFHKLELLGGNNIEDYTISQYDALCCIPVTISNNKITEFKYGHTIQDYEWEFTNSTSSLIQRPGSSQMPFIVNNTKPEKLKPGFYNIVFRYKLSDDNTNKFNTFSLNSAFKVKYM